MSQSETQDDERRERPRWFQFHLSTLLLLTLIAAMAVAWGIERSRRDDPLEFPGVAEHRIHGHFKVSYSHGYQRGSTWYASHHNLDNVVAIDFCPNYLILHFEGRESTIISPSEVTNLRILRQNR